MALSSCFMVLVDEFELDATPTTSTFFGDRLYKDSDGMNGGKEQQSVFLYFFLLFGR